MQYQVRFVEDEELPDDYGWALVHSDGTAYLFIKQSAIDVDTGRCDALTRAWEVWSAASVELEQVPG